MPKYRWDVGSAIGQNRASESPVDLAASGSKVSLAHGVNPSRTPTHELSFGDTGDHAGVMLRSSSAATINLTPL